MVTRSQDWQIDLTLTFVTHRRSEGRMGACDACAEAPPFGPRRSLRVPCVTALRPFEAATLNSVCIVAKVSDHSGIVVLGESPRQRRGTFRARASRSAQPKPL